MANNQEPKSPMSMMVAVMVGGLCQLLIPIPAIGFLIGFIPTAIYIGNRNLSRQ